MKKFALNTLAAGMLLLTAQTSSAQNAVLSEMYGHGVHAYYAGNMEAALEHLTMAIDNEIKDPRAYYFRGMVHHATGRPEQAESDWQAGAEMEAARGGASIGKSLSRFQGSARVKLESIRQQAKLKALAEAMKRSKQRYGELDAAGRAAAMPPAPVPPTGAPPIVAPTPPDGVTNPFADDMADGQPQVVADDAFAGALDDPFAGEADAGAAGAAAAAPATDPFGGAGAGGADPFGGAGGGADPFGGAGNAGGADPFGGGGGADPFGGGADDAGGADPFGGGAGDDPFN